MALSRRERQEQRKKLWKEKKLDDELLDSHAHIFQKKEYTGLLGFYDRQYLKLLAIPLILFVICLGLFIHKIATTGDFVNKGISLEGGLVLTVPVQAQVDLDKIKDALENRFPTSEIEVRAATELGEQKAVIIMTDVPENRDAMLQILNNYIPGATENFSSENTGAALGGSFFKETTKAMIFAFIFMGLVIFISFRSFIPSMIVVFTVLANMIETIAIVNLLGIKVSTAGIASFLMLIGYSVDTDILLTSRVLRGKEGTVFQKTIDAAKTGLMMTFTALIAVVISLIMTQNETIREIMLILFIGLIFDIINTWLQNTALLRYYIERMLPRKVAAAASRQERKQRRQYEDAIKMGAADDDSADQTEENRN